MEDRDGLAFARGCMWAIAFELVVVTAIVLGWCKACGRI